MQKKTENSSALPPGTASLTRGDFTAVIRECTEALKADPGCADAYCNRARAERALGDLDGAIADAAEAVRLDPSHAWAHRTLGDVHLALGNLKAAVAYCDAAIRLDPSLAVAYNTRAGALLRLKDLHAALRDCNKAIQLGPHLWGAYITRANVRYHLHDPNNDDDYQIAFAMNPTGYARGVMQIILFQVRHELDDLFASCAEYLAQDPRDSTSYVRRGLALFLLGKDSQARLDFDRALAIRPVLKDRLAALFAEVERLRSSSAPGEIPAPRREE